MWVEWNTFLFQIVVYHVCHGRRERLFSRTKLLQKQKGEKNVVMQAFVLCSCVKLVFLGYGSGMKHSKAKLINSSILITVYMLAFTSLLTLLCHSHIQLPILTSITVLLTVLPSYLRLSSPENINFTSLIYVFCLQIGSTSLHDDTAEDPIMNGRVEIEPTINYLSAENPTVCRFSCNQKNHIAGVQPAWLNNLWDNLWNLFNEQINQRHQWLSTWKNKTRLKC